MEGRESGIGPGVTMIGGEAPPSAYQVAPRLENQPQAVPPPHPGAQLPELSGTPAISGEKRKRGRPRKYAPDGTVNMALTTRPISASAPRAAGDYSSVKMQGKSRAPGSDYKQKKKAEFGYFPGDENTSGLGTCFMPHIVQIKSGEDITMRIIALSQQGPRAVCILAASGYISTVTLVQDGSSGGTLTYEGRFEILQLSGAFTPTDVQGTRSRAGSMSITLVGANGQVLGGVVAGILIAASPIQLIVGSFLPVNHQLQQKPKKQQRVQHGPETPSLNMPIPNADNEDGLSHNHNHRHQNATGPRPDLGAPSHFQRDSWPSMNTMHEPRSLVTDINMEASLNNGGSASRTGGLNLYPDHSDH